MISRDKQINKMMSACAEMGLLVGKGASVDRACAIQYVVANCQEDAMCPHGSKVLESLVKLLQGLGGDINRPDNSGGDTPLHVAASVQNVATVRCLLALGAGPSRRIKNANGKTPIQAFKSE